MAKSIQCHMHGACSLSIEKACTKFSFSSTGHYFVHDLAENMDGAIIWWCWISGNGGGIWPGTEEVITGSA